jgi:hypothetical protein
MTDILDETLDETKVLVNRIAPRHELDTKVRISLQRDGLEATYRGWVRDLSESGLRAFVAQELVLDERVTICIALGKADKESLVARVARKLGTEYGFQFTSLSVEQRLRIQETLRQQLAKGASADGNVRQD